MGGSVDASADKVPTQIGYNSYGEVENWGFHASDGDFILKEFYLYLDPYTTYEHDSRLSHEKAVKFYIDFMRCLYQHLEGFFSQSVSEWETRNVEYLFSIPTTWKDPRSTEDLKQWLTEAEFANRHNRRVSIPHTAAEAAAIYATTLPFEVI